MITVQIKHVETGSNIGLEPIIMIATATHLLLTTRSMPDRSTAGGDSVLSQNPRESRDQEVQILVEGGE